MDGAAEGGDAPAGAAEGGVVGLQNRQALDGVGVVGEVVACAEADFEDRSVELGQDERPLGGQRRTAHHVVEHDGKDAARVEAHQSVLGASHR